MSCLNFSNAGIVDSALLGTPVWNSNSTLTSWIFQFQMPNKLDFYFLSLSNKYGLRGLAFVVDIGTCARNIFRQVYQIHIADMYHQAHGSFGLIGIGNVGNQVLTKPLVVSGLQNLANNAQDFKKSITGCAQILYLR